MKHEPDHISFRYTDTDTSASAVLPDIVERPTNVDAAGQPAETEEEKPERTASLESGPA